jgi:hypothetical protein
MIASTGALTNEALLLSLPIPFFKEGFSFLLRGRLTTPKVRDNHQDRVSDGDRSSFGSSTFGDPARLLSQIAVFVMRSRMGGLHEEAS